MSAHHSILYQTVDGDGATRWPHVRCSEPGDSAQILRRPDTGRDSIGRRTTDAVHSLHECHDGHSVITEVCPLARLECSADSRKTHRKGGVASSPLCDGHRADSARVDSRHPAQSAGYALNKKRSRTGDADPDTGALHSSKNASTGPCRCPSPRGCFANRTEHRTADGEQSPPPRRAQSTAPGHWYHLIADGVGGRTPAKRECAGSSPPPFPMQHSGRAGQLPIPCH